MFRACQHLFCSFRSALCVKNLDSGMQLNEKRCIHLAGPCFKLVRQGSEKLRSYKTDKNRWN